MINGDSGMRRFNRAVLTRNSTTEKPKILNFLNKMHKTEQESSDELQITHVNDIDKPWACKNCNRQYKWKNSLFQHLRNECGIPPRFSCERNCGYKTNVNSNLKRHNASCKLPIVTDLTV